MSVGRFLPGENGKEGKTCFWLQGFIYLYSFQLYSATLIISSKVNDYFELISKIYTTVGFI